MGFWNKKKKEEKGEIRPSITIKVKQRQDIINYDVKGDIGVEIIEEKASTRKCVMEITLVNNKTDKEYVAKSENNFGITWEYSKGNEVLCINQRNFANTDLGWTAIGRFIDFSVLNTTWKTFDIEDIELTNDLKK